MTFLPNNLPSLPRIVSENPLTLYVSPQDAEKAAFCLMVCMEKQGGYTWLFPNRISLMEWVLCVAGLQWLQGKEGFIWAARRPGTTDWLVRMLPAGRAWLREQIADGGMQAVTVGAGGEGGAS